MTNERYVGTQTAKRVLGVCGASLRQWADSGLISSFKTPGGKYRYLIDPVIKGQQVPEATPNPSEKYKICYCRVSSTSQKADLDRQVQYMATRFPSHTIIKDIGSGINFKRKGLQTLLELTFSGRLEEVVVAYRDRLCRIAFELLSWIFQQHGVQLMVLHEELGSSENELSEDLMAIVQVFCCRANGKRKYQKRTSQTGHKGSHLPEQGSSGGVDEVVRMRPEDLQHGAGGALEADCS